ncbi:MAG: hypothetical protein Q4Q04_00070 [Methanocorpusculum sp.]|nr:hypothetical protein [Methanocorpusculum sp.]
MTDDGGRGSFSGKLGFILTAAGAAIGLGCIWRFPYLTAQYGGGIFIFVYLLLLALLGFPLLMTEIAIGRKTQTGILGAFTKLNKKFAFLGYLCLLISLLVQPYYAVLGGWREPRCCSPASRRLSPETVLKQQRPVTTLHLSQDPSRCSGWGFLFSLPVL